MCVLCVRRIKCSTLFAYALPYLLHPLVSSILFLQSRSYRTTYLFLHFYRSRKWRNGFHNICVCFFCRHHLRPRMFPTKIVGSSYRRESYLEHEIRVVHFLCCPRRTYYLLMCRRRWARDSPKVNVKISVIVRRLLICEMRQEKPKQKSKWSLNRYMLLFFFYFNRIGN